jgi:Fe(II)/alpha-ketoglutarate-dependent arginine beta-hydroxylase
MLRIVLEGAEVSAIEKLLAGAAARYQRADDKDFLLEATVLAQELPRRLRSALNSFRLTEPDDAVCIVSGFPIDEAKIGPTPEHWNRSGAERSSSLEEEILFVLACSLLGECFGWKTQQGGRIVHDVMPIRGMEQEQIGTGSEQTIWWHTEDAFHPLHGDYVALMCLRNPDRVPTTFASLEELGLADDDWQLLFEPHYTIQPDNSHRPENAAVPPAAGNGYSQIERMLREPEKIPLLSGDRRSPYIRIDPYFMNPPTDDPRALRAYRSLVKALDAKLGDVVLEPGDICFIDNRKSVHGRRAFKARYDGRDRWFKRTNIVRDLRRSRAARSEASSRIIQ